MIPVFNLTRIHKTIEKELKESFRKTLNDGIFILGKNVETFEREFSSFVGCKFGVGVASGTEALSLSLQALNIQPGDEVILPANAYPTVFSITSIGAIPRPVDIDPNTFCMDPKKLEEALRLRSGQAKKIKAVIVVHMYGRPADIVAIKKITDRYNIPLIEDCAHAHGGKIKVKSQKLKVKSTVQNSKVKEREDWKMLGTYGIVSCFSFYPTKNLGALGDGGMVLTDNSKIAEKVKLLRMYGEKNRYESILLGRNSRLDEVQAGFLLVKLKYLDKWNRERREIAKWYEKYLASVSSIQYTEYKKNEEKNTEYCILNTVFCSESVYHLYVIRTPHRDKLKNYLMANRIGTGIHYPTPVHLIPSLKFLGYKKGDFPESEKASEEVLSLPLWLGMKEEEVGEVCLKVKEFFKQMSSRTLIRDRNDTI